MDPETIVPFRLTLADAHVILTMLTKAAVPGEYWFGTFVKVVQQRDEFLAAQAPAQNVRIPAGTTITTAPDPAPAPTQEG